MTNTLVIDTSYGSTVGVVGHEPVVEQDSRTHVERLQVDIATAIEEAGLRSSDIERIVVGIGPAPFTGLRAGIVTAKALAFATGAELLGQDALSVQADMMAAYRRGAFSFPSAIELSVTSATPAAGQGAANETLSASAAVSHATLAVNDARRKQLYFTLVADDDNVSGNVSNNVPSNRSHGTDHGDGTVLIDMDIDYPQRIVERVNAAIAQRDSLSDTHTVVDVVGHGAVKYAESWSVLSQLGMVLDASVLDMGAQGLARYAEHAHVHAHANSGVTQADSDGNADGGTVADSYTNHRAISPTDAIEPLYLRRPDVSVPSPLKHVLHHAGADRAE